MPLFVHEYEVQKPRWGGRGRGGKMRGGGGGAKKVRARGARGAVSVWAPTKIGITYQTKL